MGKDGTTYYGIGLDNSKFKKQAQETINEFKRISDEARKEGQKFSNNVTLFGRSLGDKYKSQISAIEKEINSYSRSIISQKSLIKDIEFEYTKMRNSAVGLYGSDKTARIKEATAIKRVLLEEKAALFGLSTAQSTSRLKLREVNQEYRDYQNNVSRASGLSKIFNSNLLLFGAGAGIGLAVVSKKLIDVTGQFQMLNVAFRTILQSKEKADKLMAEIVQTAISTPFQLTELATGAKQLVAYGFAAEEVNGTLIKLGNVAAALGLPLERLTYLYGTTRTQGRLMARDMMQFTTSGIPLLDELAKMYGKSTQEINKMVSAGKIGFPEVERAFNQMTGKGGKFFNLMQEQAKTIPGKISNLQDSITVMLNKIGSSQAGMIAGTVDAAGALVSNYELVGKAILVLVATYGAYKAAVIVAAAMESGWTITQLAHYRALLLVEKGQKLLNATMLANPYVAIAAVLMGLITAMIVFHDKTTAQEKAQNKLNESMKQAKEYRDQMQNETQSFISIITSETNTVWEQVRAWDELIKKYKFFAKYSIEELRNMSDKERTKLISEAISQQDKDSIQSLYDVQKKEVERLQNEINKYKEKAKSDAPGTRQNAESNLLRLNEEMSVATALLRKLEKEQINLQKQQQTADILSLPTDQQAQYWEKRLEQLKKLREISVNDTLRTDPEKQSLAKILGEQIQEAQKKVDALRSKDIVKNKDYWKKMRDDAQEIIDQMGVEQIGSVEWRKQQDLVDKANKEFEKYSKKDKTAKENASLDANDTLNEKTKQLELSLIQSQIDIMSDGKNKELALIKQRTLEKIVAIEKEKNDLISIYRKNKKQLTAEQLKIFDERSSNVQTQGKIEEVSVTKKYTDQIKKMFQEATEFTLSETEREKQAITDKYDSLIIRAKEAGASNIDIIRLITLQVQEIDSVISSQSLKLTDFYKKVYEDVSLMGYSTLVELRDRVSSALDSAKMENKDGKTVYMVEISELDAEGKAVKKIVPMTIEEFTRLKEKLNEFDRSIRDKNPFKGVVDGVENVFKAISSGDKKALGNAIEGLEGSINGSIASIKQWGQSLGSVFGEDVEQAVSTLAELASGMAGIGIGAAKFAAGDVFGGVSSAISGIGSIISVLFDGIHKYNEDVKKHVQDVKDLNIEYNILLNEQIRTASQNQSIFYENYRNIIRDAVSATIDAKNKLESSLDGKTLKDYLANLEITIGITKKRLLMLFVIGSENVYGSLLKKFPDLINAAGQLNVELAKIIINSGQLKEESKNALEELIAYQEAYEAALQSVKDTIKDLVSSLGDDLYGAINNMWLDGSDNATAFFDVVNEGLQGLVSQMLYTTIFSDLFDNLQEQLISIYTNTGLSDEQLTQQLIDLFSNFYSDADGLINTYNKAMDAASAAAKKGGFDWESISSTRTGTSKGIATASQDSIDETNGRLTTMQQHTHEMNETLRNIFLSLSTILIHLIGIETNTARLKNIEDGINSINDRGVKIR